MEITSLANSRIKHAVKLRQRSYRDAAGEMLIEGYRECRRALDHGCIPKTLFHCEKLYLKNVNEPSLVNECREKGVLCLSCPTSVFKKIAYRERPDGLLMIAPQLKHTLHELILPDNALLVVAESIEKPGNLGTILRSADAAGVHAVIVCDRCTDIHNPNVVRASTGTLFSVPIIETTSEEALVFLKQHNFRILAATPHAAPLHSQVNLTGNIAVALGTEQYGLTRQWMVAADLRVRIPMMGLADSLNVSAAATILLFEALRQRIDAGLAKVPPHEPWHGESQHDA
jgi:RNA methyltransferase, TrmH family